MKVRYIGKKERKEDNVAGTGVVWRHPGDVQDVPDVAWAKLSKHPDVWAPAETSRAPSLAQAAKVKAPAPAPAPVANAERVKTWKDFAAEGGLSLNDVAMLVEAGGPGTDAGKVLWNSFTNLPLPDGLDLSPDVGSAAAAPAPAPAPAAAPAAANKKPDGGFVVKKGGEWVALDGMDLPALKAFAESVAVKLHPQAKEPSVRQKLVDAQPKGGW